MKRQKVWLGMVGVATVAAVTFGLVGCDSLNLGRGQAAQLPARLVVWGDPETGDELVTVLDVNEETENPQGGNSGRFVVIGTGGEVQFSGEILKVCKECGVEGSTILVDGEPRMHIRWSQGPDGDGERFPFLVSTDGFYIQMVLDGDVIRFDEEDDRFEEDDDPSDDLAVRVGTIANPALG